MIEINGSDRFDRIGKLAGEGNGVSCISGITDSRSAAVSGIIAEGRKGQLLIITSSHARAEKLAEDLSLFTKKNIFVLPEEAPIRINFEAKSQDMLMERLAAMSALASGKDCVVIASVLSSLKTLAPISVFLENTFLLKRGDEVDFELLKRQLSHMGYERVGTVEAKGQYVIRAAFWISFRRSDSSCRVEFSMLR